MLHAMNTCTQEDCDREIYAKGICRRHYDIAMRRRKGVAPKPVKGFHTCTEEGCERPVYAKGICTRHYDEARRRAAGVSPAPPKADCSENGCDLVATRKGMCQNHYRQAKRRERGLKKPGPKADAEKPFSRLNTMTSHHTKHEICAAGHPWEDGSFKLATSGMRVCLICIEENRPPHCPAGHDYAIYGRSTKQGWTICKECVRLRMPVQRPRRYGIELSDVEEMLIEQKGCCKSCRREFADGGYSGYSIDHDHDCCKVLPACGNCVRGLLCKYCNSTLGYCKDSPDILRSLADYAESWQLSRA